MPITQLGEKTLAVLSKTTIWAYSLWTELTNTWSAKAYSQRSGTIRQYQLRAGTRSHDRNSQWSQHIAIKQGKPKKMAGSAKKTDLYELNTPNLAFAPKHSLWVSRSNASSNIPGLVFSGLVKTPVKSWCCLQSAICTGREKAEWDKKVKSGHQNKRTNPRVVRLKAAWRAKTDLFSTSLRV